MVDENKDGKGKDELVFNTATKILVANLAVVDGFNLRDIDPKSAQMEELKASIKANGFRPQFPVVVGPVDQDGSYPIRDGHRRYYAVKALVKDGVKGLDSIPCVMEPANTKPDQLLIDQLIGNDGEPLKPLEEALGYQRLVDGGMSAVKIANRTGKSNTYVYNRLLLLTLPPVVIGLLRSNKINTNTAQELARQLKEKKIDAATCESLAKGYAKGGLDFGEGAPSPAAEKTTGNPAKVKAPKPPRAPRKARGQETPKEAGKRIAADKAEGKESEAAPKPKVKTLRAAKIEELHKTAKSMVKAVKELVKGYDDAKSDGAENQRRLAIYWQGAQDALAVVLGKVEDTDLISEDMAIKAGIKIVPTISDKK